VLLVSGEMRGTGSEVRTVGGWKPVMEEWSKVRVVDVQRREVVYELACRRREMLDRILEMIRQP
jgi:hypothetical protein